MKKILSVALAAILTVAMLSVPALGEGEAPKPTATITPPDAPESTAAAVDEPTADPTAAPVGEPTADPTAAPDLRLAGLKIGIDPGHQGKANNQKEPIAPGSKKTKAKVSSGTAGVKSRVAEHVVNLEISLQLRDALEALGAEVLMTRESADVDLSNVDRAVMMNEWGADLVLRLHCNGSERKSAHGIGLYIIHKGDCAEASALAAEAIMPALIAATGAREDGIFKRDNYTGLNWSEVPSMIVEMGYMSNAAEDALLNDPAYQQKLVSGMVEGIAAYFGR